MTDVRSGRGATAWLAVAALLGAGTLAALAWPASALDWQPGLAITEPWRAWTAAFVHWSDRHLLVNLAGLAVVAALGVAARVPASSAIAWLLAWPLAHAALALQPALLHYGGLSGVLHAGTAVAAVALLPQGGGRRAVGVALLAGLALKIASEAPWAGVLRPDAALDIAVAPLAHAAGAAAGVLVPALVHRLGYDRSRRRPCR